MVDIDGWHMRDLIVPLFFNDNNYLHCLIRERLILPYFTGSFQSSFFEEYVDRLLMDLQKQDGGLRPILRRYFASLAANATPVRLRSSHLLMITYYSNGRYPGWCFDSAKLLSFFL